MSSSRRPKQSKDYVLRSVYPNLGIEVAYRQHLLHLIDQMHASVTYWVEARYKKIEPAILAQDASTDVLIQIILELSQRWTKRFDTAARRLALYFTKNASQRTDATLKKILSDGGWTVKFHMTSAMQNTIDATIEQNIGLIKSIPQQYLGDVQGAVMRSIQVGGDLKTLTQQLDEIYHLPKNRAALIALDQNKKATAAMTRTRQIEMGLFTAKWRHSNAGKEPRPAHVAMNDKTYDVRQGMYDKTEGRYIIPGELIHCRCTSATIVPGFVS